jgi:ATP-dependent DNA helicase RecG
MAQPPSRPGVTAAPAVAVADRPISVLKGAGPRVCTTLGARGLHSLQDLWFHLPLRYEDRTRQTPVAQLVPGVAALVDGVVEAVERSFRFRPQLRVAIRDAAGDTLVLRFIHFRGAQVTQFAPGRRLAVYGAPRAGQFSLEMVHPSYRFLSADESAVQGDQLDPIYPAIEGIGPAALAKLIHAALDQLPPDSELELLPAKLLASRGLPSLSAALRCVHRPAADVDIEALRLGQHPAQSRLALEELLAHHLSLRRQRIAVQQLGARAISGRGALATRLRKALPFALTAAQTRVLGEVVADMRRSVPMLRLVQGDVGSGKTVVAALAALHALESGGQVALVAPTELLAEQHLVSLTGWLQPLGITVEWLAGKVTGKARQRVLAAMADGSAQLVVGTHALMQEGVLFDQLNLCIIDEQHRFGVHQRLALRDKGRDGSRVPHQLVMTATPIPRTLAMTAYADLDVSVIDELPPGRTPVRTVAINGERRPQIIERIRAACAQGRQAYWVCTLIEESEEGAGPAAGVTRIEAQAAQTTYEALSEQLPELRIGLVHGRLKASEKQAAMAAFKAGETHLLVATTVIEVGVDVPNASLMLIENAERLGLSQLHQLRGRVGRGAEASSCVLLYRAPLSALAQARLEALRQTNDGFVIAEKDLELRGPGELLGTRQTGLAQFRIADLARDADLLPLVREVGDDLLRDSPAAAAALVRRWVGVAERYAGV